MRGLMGIICIILLFAIIISLGYIVCDRPEKRFVVVYDKDGPELQKIRKEALKRVVVNK